MSNNEPVGVVSWHEGTVMGSIFPSSNMPKDGDKLYINAQQLAGLTENEIDEIKLKSLVGNPADWDIEPKRFAKNLLTKLGEKNNVTII